MNWKNIGLFGIMFLVVLILTLGLSMHISWFMPIFLIAYAVLLALVLRKYSTGLLIGLIVLVCAYILLMTLNFPLCDYGPGEYTAGDGQSKECSCLGIKKYSWRVVDASWSQCVGIILEHRCYEDSLLETSQAEWHETTCQ